MNNYADTFTNKAGSETEEASIESRPSKSEIKRRMEALQKTGEALIALSGAQLTAIPLPDVLRLAVQEAQGLHSRHALKRQRQYIGKLMRDIDATPIEQALHDLETMHDTQNARFHEIEYWRDRLLADHDTNALTELLAAHPGFDVQQLRQQLQQARRERQTNAGKRAQRKLFTVLRDMLTDS
ncbi:MAG: ribosome biogenesis factor YjgA [Mariprofundaceae bacterium]|nr:ribosome biogenesis factor YjgA [Mariprofundaceae bacterium]